VTEVFPSDKGNTQFIIVYQLAKNKKDKKQKHYFKAASPELTMLWLKCINKFTRNLNEDDMTNQILHDIEANENPSSDSGSHHYQRTIDSSTKKVKEEKETPGVFDEFSRQNLYNAFHSRLFVDDCDLNVKIKALNDIQEMFKNENASLMKLITEDEEKYAPLKSKIRVLSNLSNTMD
jgi:hypothetical protein